MRPYIDQKPSDLSAVEKAMILRRERTKGFVFL